jgi:hypothetical protein
MAMFPPAIPHLFIQWLTEPGDVVYDPFSGRGTTVLESCLMGRVGLGSDANPLAWLLTSTKADPPRPATVTGRLAELATKRGRPYAIERVAPEIRMLFDPTVLEHLLRFRARLDLSRKVDRYLMATLVGMLHGNANRNGVPRGLSVPMPNTFAMAPAYVRRYIRKHNLRPPKVNVHDALTRRIATFPLPDSSFQRGSAWLQDATHPIAWPATTTAKLVFTSPPYLEVMKYAKLNWIRHWFLQSDRREVDSRLFTSSSLQRYLAFVTNVITNIRPILRDDGYCCLVLGDVRREQNEINLARAVSASSIGHTDLRILAIIKDSLPVQHKVSRIWGPRRGRATRTDRILVLGGPKAKPLPRLTPIDWSSN